MFILWWITVGLIAGWITGKIMKGPGYGVLMDTVVGVVGAIIGGFIMRALGFAGEGGMIYTICVAVLGAVMLTWIVRLFKKPFDASHQKPASPPSARADQKPEPAKFDTSSPLKPAPPPSPQADQRLEPVRFDTSNELKSVPLPSARADQRRDARPASTPKDVTDQPPPIQSSADIFISYASQDRPTAATLATALQNEGWSVWCDRTIPPGKTFDEVIEAALSEAKCIVVLWSEHSVKSDWVKVEAAEGAKKRILIPAVIAEVTIPLEFRRLQHASLLDRPGPDRHPGFESLATSVAVLLGKPRSSRANPAGM